MSVWQPPTESPDPRRVGSVASRFKRIAARYIVAAGTPSSGLRLAFDVESDGFVDQATKVHCIVVANLDSEEIDAYGPDRIAAALEHLLRADYLIGHNVCGYDLPLLLRLYNWAPRSDCTVVDTLVASRLILPNLDDLDDQAAAMGDPPLAKLRGRYSLEAWGARLGILKIGTDITDWSVWTPEMQQRCAGDVAICKALWRFLQPTGYSQAALTLEHRVAAICNQITAAGVPFDIDAAERLRQQWTARRAELEARLSQQFPGTKLSSRQQISALLEARGWVPEKRTKKTGRPKIDDELLETIHELYSEFTGLAEHYTLGRRLGQLSNGAQAWCRHVGADGRIHGGLVHVGTPHSRAKHLNPNLAQVPNPKKGKPFATECRALFCAPDGWMFVTADQASLQDRGYAHYLHEFDNGAYAQAFLEGADPHWRSAVTLGLVTEGTKRDKQDKVHTAIREGAKRFRYAFLYGCGPATAGRIVNDTIRAVQQIDSADELQQRFLDSSAHPNEAALKRIGKRALDKFETGTPGLQRLRQSLKAHAHRHEWLPGLDGRRVPVRALYSALNFIVTSSEAIICKRWLVRVHDELCDRFRYGWDGDVVTVLWIHDELAVCCRSEIADQVGEIMVRHAKEPGEFYGFKVPLDAEYKIGRSWAGEPIDGGSKPAAEPITPATANAREPAHADDAEGCYLASDDGDEHDLGGDRHNGDGADHRPSPAELAVGPPPDDPPNPPLDGQPAWTTPVLIELAGVPRCHIDPVNYPPSSPGDEEILRPAPRARPNGSGQRDGYAVGEESNEYARHDLDHERLPADPGLSQGDGANPVRPSVAGGISGAPGARADQLQNRETNLRARLHVPGTYQTVSDFAPHPHGDSGPKQGRLVLTWIYTHLDQRNYLRIDKHQLPNGERCFYQHHWNGTGWAYGIKGTYAERKIPYRLPELKVALAVNPNTELHICEGEKDCETLARLGFIATTNPGGALSWTEDLTVWLRALGVRRAVIHEDHDEAGERRTTALNKALSGFVNLRIVHYPDVPTGEDVTWWIEHGHTREELAARIAAAPQLTAELGEWDAGDDVGPPSPRSWLLGGQFCRTFLSGLVAPGATGKTALRLLQAIALATGRPLTSQYVFRRCRVLVVSFEDDQEELKRRVLAARLHHNVNADELKGWLFLASPKGLKLVEMRNGHRIVGQLEPTLRRAIERRRPDLVVLDPFVKLHGLEENDNSAMDYVADLLTQLAHEYDIAIDSPAHTRKGLTVAGDADARRGASAARDAGRLDYTLIPMTEKEAKVFGIAAEERRSYVRLDSAKVNLLPPARKADWFRLVSVDLDNATADYPAGDRVQTVEPWIPPDTWDGLDTEALDAALSDIDAGLPNRQRYSNENAATSRAAWPVVQKHCPTKTEAQCREIIRTWLKTGALREIDYDDPIYRKSQKGLQVDGQKRPN